MYYKKNKIIASILVISSLSFGLFNAVNAKAKVKNINKSILVDGKSISIPNTDVKQKRQFRSAWVSTVFNIDFNQTNGSVSKFKNEFNGVLDKLESVNMNAVTFQVRPSNDAFYPSKLNPWSQFLTGVQGKAMEGGFDPLKYMVEETHKRNMEFHAWFNPYRVTVSASKADTKSILDKLSPENFARKNPQYVINSNGKLILNPGEPQVQKFIIDTVMEVVKNYDIDAVHFDDYFYPYDSSFGKKNEDLQTFKKYGARFKNINDWRRNNIDTLIKTLNQTIKKQKPYVKFGISPFGIWGSKAKHPDGSDTSAGTLSSYDTLYADTKKWAQSGWIDYITPQIYWSFNRTDAPYGELADWWSNVVKNSNCSLYIGHGLYRYTEGTSGSDKKDWQNQEEIFNQLRFNSLYPEIKGSTFFSLNDFKVNKDKVVDKLKTSFFSKPALIPTMPWLDKTPPNKITGLKVVKSSLITLKWNDLIKNDSAYYVVYRFEAGKTVNLDNADAILAKVRRENKAVNISFNDKSANVNKKYVYVVTSVDRLNNESDGVIAK